jgi:hypothetical protein
LKESRLLVAIFITEITCITLLIIFFIICFNNLNNTVSNNIAIPNTTVSNNAPDSTISSVTTDTTYSTVVPNITTSIKVIAASDSSDSWKAQAAVVCDGVSDEIEINTYLVNADFVVLAPGTFNCDNNIIPQSNSCLLGQGNTTIISFNDSSGNRDTNIYVYNKSNVEIGNFKITGIGDINIQLTTSQSNLYIHDIWSTAKGVNDFVIYCISGSPTLSNISFVRCTADNPDGRGFYVTTGIGSPTVDGLTFFRCDVINAGIASTRRDIWVTGFSFCDATTMTLKNMQAIKCTVNGAWESDFHFESRPTKINCVIMDSTATNAGRKPGSVYGAGFLVDGLEDMVLSNNVGSGNSIADLVEWSGSGYTNYTPVQDKILPASSTKTTSRVSQGNCSGLIVTNGNYKDLYLFSNDGSEVSQKIELGGYYTSNDDNIYIFNGTKLFAQFNDYQVIRLVTTTK